MVHSSTNVHDDIAIIGMSCRFPGDATSPEKLLDMLRNGRDAWSEVPKDRFDVSAYHHPSHERQGATVARGGYFLKQDLAAWDAPFFSMTSAEANAMDPQQRLLLEATFEAFENAGLPIASLIGSDMACFVGAFTKDYDQISSRDLNDKLLYTATGGGLTMLSNRLSWFYDLRGPSATLDTACSSSLVGLHLACEAIRSSRNNTRTALVGGSGLILSPDIMTSMSALHFLSPDSRSYSFDDRGNGYARGEGVGLLVLKHLDDAIRDGDCIRAVVRGTGVNQDGKTPGITLPSSEAQARLIRMTYESCGLDFSKTMYFEAHGTGTAAGDPLEAQAIGSTFGADPHRESAIFVGSIKSNIGHLEGCAGIAGVIKAILSLEAGLIFPQYDFQKPNPKINLQDWKIRIPTTLTAWPSDALRRASVNSFGYGGTNAHVILDDARNYLRERGITGVHKTIKPRNAAVDSPDFRDSAIETPDSMSLIENLDRSSELKPQYPRLFTISSSEQAAISRIASNLVEYLHAKIKDSQVQIDQCLGDLAYTLTVRRSSFQWRSYVVAATANDLVENMLPATKSAFRANKVPRLLWVFTGQGAQWARMASDLLRYRVFADVVRSAEQHMTSFGAEWSVEAELLADEDKSRINEPQYSQPLCTIVQIGIVELIRHWGITPAAVIGHSSGEIAAAYAVGALSARDAYLVAYHRGRLSQQLTGTGSSSIGAMMSVGLSRKAALPYLEAFSAEGAAVIACDNSPSNVTVSGDKTVIESLEKKLQSDGIFARTLKVANAYHSPYMEPIAAEYLKALQDIKPNTATENPQMYSTVTGLPVQAEKLGAEYWVQNMTQPVEFVAALKQIFGVDSEKQRKRRRNRMAADTILEIGPHGALQGPLKQFLASYTLSDQVQSLSILSRGKEASHTILEAVGKLWSTGCVFDLQAVNCFDPQRDSSHVLVDLPAYPWNHSNRYWHESSQSRNHRFPICGRLDYAGMPVEDFNAAKPLFKNNLRASELPWLLDHKVQNNIIFPGAGMICAAVEASMQLAEKEKRLIGFNIRDITIGQALVIPADDSGIETFLQLRPHKTGMRSTSSFWQEWTFSTISSYGVSTEHCSGLISLVYDSSVSVIDDGREIKAQMQSQLETYLAGSKKCTSSMGKSFHYDTMKAAGINYGPIFQNLGDITVGPETACATITIPDTRAVMPSEIESHSVIHPAVLDAFFQSCFPAFSDDAAKLKEAMVPTLIEHIFIPIDIPRNPGDMFRALTQTSKRGFRELSANILASNDAFDKLALTIMGLIATGVGSDAEQLLILDSNKVLKSRVCAELVNRPDVSFITQASARTVLGRDLEDPDGLRRFQHESAKAAAIWVQRTLKAMTPEMKSEMAPHFRLYCEWMQEIFTRSQERKHPHQHGFEDWLSFSEEEEDQFLAEFGASNRADGLLMNCIAQNLLDIMTGKTQALSVMMENNMLSASYSDAHGLISGTKIFSQWFDLAAHKNPDMKILEIGAGTASVTLPVLNVLGGKQGAPARFASYTFTDISSGFFGNAQTLLADWANFVEYKKLDIEHDPEAQGFALGSFDVIAASNVLHATKRIDVTLRNCLKLLKPGGSLILGEVTRPTDYVSMVYGVLPGWWLSEDGRTGGPLMTERQWDENLRQAGFSGVNYSVADSTEEMSQSLSVLVSTKSLGNHFPAEDVLLVVQERSTTQKLLAEVLSRNLSQAGIHSEILPLTLAAQRNARKMTISLCEVNSTLLYDISSDAFDEVKALILKSSRLLWVTSSSEYQDPSHRIASGLFRSAMCEHEELRLHELHLSTEVTPNLELVGHHIFQAFSSNFQEHVDLGESEMIEISGQIHIPRYMDCVPANKRLERLHTTPSPEPQPLVQERRPLKLTVGSPGMLDTLHFIDDASHETALPEDHVEIEIRANALNFVDVMIAMGKIPDDTLGVDAAGVVKRVGASVKTLKCGDRVTFPQFGSFATLVRTHEIVPQVIPDSMTFEEACTLPIIHMTAYQSIVEIGRLQPGETLLVHAAAGGLGQALIQLAKYIGAEVYATVGTLAKKELIVSLGVEPDHIFSSRDLTFAQGIMRMTKGKGVDVVVNSLAGEALRKTWDCIADFGRFIEVGKVDILGNTGLEMMPFLKNVTFAGVNIEHMSRNCVPRSAALLGKILELVRVGALGPVSPITVYDYSDMEVAFRTMQQGRHTGKLVLKISADSKVPVLPKVDEAFSLDSQATYILAGGLGGLGRSQAIHMVNHGARHLVFLSRSGATKSEAQKTLQDLEALGVKTKAIACDIADLGRLQQAVESLAHEFPPIRGVVQGAMVLNDGLFEKMTHERWIAATRPKIQGTWNLHKVLPKDLDFFVMLSSCTGIIGARGQSNYAAGNTFQDAFASYRRSLGLEAQTLDLGITTGIGFFEENRNTDAMNYMNFLSAIHIDASQFLSTFESALIGSSNIDHKLPAQLLMGAGSGGLEKLNDADGKGYEFFWLSKFSSFKYLKKLDLRSFNGGNAIADDNGAESLQARLATVTSTMEASEICQEALVAKLAKSMLISEADIDTRKPLHSYGVDSLVAVEVRNWIMRELKADVSIFDILANIAISQLGASIAGKSKLLPTQLSDEKENM